MDVMENSLAKTLHNMGASSRLEELCAMCEARNIPTQNEGKDNLAVDLFNHIVKGQCAGKIGPACENVFNEVELAKPDAINTQVCVLYHIHLLLSTKQLHKVLDLLSRRIVYSIYYNSTLLLPVRGEGEGC